MTSRQARERERIEARFGRTIIEPMSGERVALLIVGNSPDGATPKFRLILDGGGWILRREEILPVDPLIAALAEAGRKNGIEYALDVAVRDVLNDHAGRWSTSRDVAEDIPGENGSVRVSASLRRLLFMGFVQSRGVSRDKQWRIPSDA